MRDKSKRPYAPTCENPDECLARAAGHGARIALESSWTYTKVPGVPLDGSGEEGEPAKEEEEWDPSD